HKKNVDFGYILWKDFVYKVEHKDAKKSNEMYYPRFTKVIVNFFMTKDQSILRRNKVNWHFASDDHMFTTIKLVSRHQNTQQYSAILPVKLTNEAIKSLESYKEYYVPKTKASVRRKQSSYDITMPPPTGKGKRLKTSAKVDKPAKEKQPAKLCTAKAMTEAQQLKLATKRSLQKTHISQASGSGADEGTGSIPRVPDVPIDESEEEISWNFTNEEGDDDRNEGIRESEGESDEEETRQEEEESFDLIPMTPEESEEENNDEEDQDLRLSEEARIQEE
nr:hypothetical protein [Tanacetum cinerariifolium]